MFIFWQIMLSLNTVKACDYSSRKMLLCPLLHWFLRYEMWLIPFMCNYFLCVIAHKRYKPPFISHLPGFFASDFSFSSFVTAKWLHNCILKALFSNFPIYPQPPTHTQFFPSFLWVLLSFPCIYFRHTLQMQLSLFFLTPRKRKKKNSVFYSSVIL